MDVNIYSVCCEANDEVWRREEGNRGLAEGDGSGISGNVGDVAVLKISGCAVFLLVANL